MCPASKYFICTCASGSTPQKSLSFPSPTAWLSPVPTGSIITRSVRSMTL